MGGQSRASLTIREALSEASSLLTDHGVLDGQRDAELLLQHLLGWDRSRLLLEWNESFPVDLVAVWGELILRRSQGEPVQYIIGEQEFYGLPFEVNPAVLIPRPETELLVEAIMKRGREQWPDGAGESRPVLVDIGTGSGAIAVSLAVFCPSWFVAACDLSKAAVEVAARNAERNRIGGKVTFYQGDLLEPVLEQGMQVDILVSNPPYIASPDIRELQREVRDHEPMLALDGGEDGLYCYRRLLEQIEKLPMVPRLVGFEVGIGQAVEVAAMLERSGWWERVEIIRDYAGIERHVLGCRTKETGSNKRF